MELPNLRTNGQPAFRADPVDDLVRLAEWLDLADRLEALCYQVQCKVLRLLREGGDLQSPHNSQASGASVT
jgi:hypothetical protein